MPNGVIDSWEKKQILENNKWHQSIKIRLYLKLSNKSGKAIDKEIHLTIVSTISNIEYFITKIIPKK